MRTALALLALALAASPARSAVTTFTFSQGGFGGGAQVTGSFTGEDTNGNGQLSSFDDEISDFTLNFAGTATVGAFTLGLADLFGLIYDLDGTLLGDGRVGEGEGILAENGTFSYVAGPGPLLAPNACLNGNICGQVTEENAIASSAQLVVVANPAIPEPATWAMMIIGFGVVGGAVRARRSSPALA
jgi:hypothetical protein